MLAQASARRLTRPGGHDRSAVAAIVIVPALTIAGSFGERLIEARA